MDCEFAIIDVKCSCTKSECPRHGKCCECVIYHRDEKQNIPVCMRNLIH